MPVADIVRTASAMRTALVGHSMVRFDAPKLIGPVPQAGRLIEQIETHGKRLEVTWDDGLVLDTHLKGDSEWHVYRPGAPWRRSWEQLRASIETDAWVAVCFKAPNIETYRQPDRGRHPGRGRLGPNPVSTTANLSEAIELILAYPDPDARLRDVLVDQHVMQGLGNVHRCEVLWAAELSPWAHVGDLTQQDAMMIVNVASNLLRASAVRGQRPASQAAPLAVYGRVGQACPRCHDSIEARPIGREGKMLYWCPGCQVRLDRRVVLVTDGIDPHPAAERYLSDLPWRTRDAS